MRYLNLNMDTTLGGENPSDEKISSQKAIKTYVDNNVKDTIEEMDDVTISQISDGQVLSYDSTSSSWKNKPSTTIVFRDWEAENS